MGSDDTGYDTQELGGGSIQIHKQNGNGNRIPLTVTSQLSINEYSLQVFPNPFREHSNIRFNLATEGDVNIQIVDVYGQFIKEIAKTNYASGDYDLSWDGTAANGRKVPSGLYYILLITPGRIINKSLLRME